MSVPPCRLSSGLDRSGGCPLDRDEFCGMCNVGPLANDNQGPFSFGSDTWPGLTKLVEEAAEVIQVASKLMATGGRVDHWSGEHLGERLEEELGDLRAAIAFVMFHNRDGLRRHVIVGRTYDKTTLFNEWHERPK